MAFRGDEIIVRDKALRTDITSLAGVLDGE